MEMHNEKIGEIVTMKSNIHAICAPKFHLRMIMNGFGTSSQEIVQDNSPAHSGNYPAGTFASDQMSNKIDDVQDMLIGVGYSPTDDLCSY